MYGVTFGEYHSYDDFNLILKTKVIGAAAVKSEVIEIPGSSTTLDLTEFTGEPQYNNRPLQFEFKYIDGWDEQYAQYEAVNNAIHGRKLKIVLDEDQGYYYLGRVSVGDWSNDKFIGLVSITCDCEPWKYKESITTVTQAVSGSAVITLNNLRKTVIPTVTVDAEMSLAWNGHSASLSSGADQIIESLVLYQGDTEITVTGTGNITFKYQEAGL